MSEQQLWDQIKKSLQKNSCEKLLSSVLDAVNLESRTLKGQTHFTIQVPSLFHQEFLKKHLSFIQEQIKNQKIPLQTINIQKKPGKWSVPKKISTSCSPPSKAIFKKTTKNSPFFSKWSFSSFVQGPNNCFAFSLAKSIAEKPINNNSNPLFIYGPSGLGKTHLLHAIGNSLETENPHLKAHYLPAERFFNDCINYIRKNEMASFRQKYRDHTHVLLLDDIQILGRGESIQEEFFHTFESLKQKGCQIVLASDQKPKDIKGLKNRIKTRFEGGIIADIQAPDKDTKVAIIKSKSQHWQPRLSEEIITYIANIPTHSIRELEGFLNKIKMFCELQNKPLCLQTVQHLFSREETSPSPSSISSSAFTKALSPACSSESLKISALQKKVCSRFHIKVSDLKSPFRGQHIVYARNLAIYIARKDLRLSLKEISYHFGNRNHSTILHSLKTIEKRQQKNPKITRDIQELRLFIHKKKTLVENF